MASGYISKPGSEYGPCKDKCKHKDCAGLRKIAKSICSICNERIDYERHMYKEGDRYVHAVCLEEKIEQERDSK